MAGEVRLGVFMVVGSGAGLETGVVVALRGVRGTGSAISLREVREGVLTTLGLLFSEPRLFAPELVSSH